MVLLNPARSNAAVPLESVTVVALQEEDSAIGYTSSSPTAMILHQALPRLYREIVKNRGRVAEIVLFYVNLDWEVRRARRTTAVFSRIVQPNECMQIAVGGTVTPSESY